MTNTEKTNVCNLVVANHLCVGCGICAGLLPNVLCIKEDKYGTYLPELVGNPINDWEELSLAVCPFSGCNENEDKISQELFGYQEKIRHHNVTGYYLECFSGFVTDENKRIHSTSGGIISFLAEKMLSSGQVDAIACVGKSDNNESLFTYQLIKNVSELNQCRKSRYYPVQFSSVIRKIKESDLRVLFIGLPCFIKAIRLAQKVDPTLNKRIVYTAGLFCGHLKSKHYSAYLARNCGVHESKITSVDFRKKIPGMPANRYAFEVGYNSHSKQIMMEDVWAGSWTNNLFMLDACEYCDDIMAETADIAVGDAWLPEYTKDYRGTSIVVCRNENILSILNQRSETGSLSLQNISAEKVVVSQSGGIRQRRTGLQYRLFLAEKKGQWYPLKRVAPDPKAGTFLFRLLQRLRIKTKQLSREAFLKQQSKEGISLFIKKMKLWIFLISLVNYLRHCKIKIKQKWYIISSINILRSISNYYNRIKRQK